MTYMLIEVLIFPWVYYLEKNFQTFEFDIFLTYLATVILLKWSKIESLLTEVLRSVEFQYEIQLSVIKLLLNVS
jgi:hypothetical protein